MIRELAEETLKRRFNPLLIGAAALPRPQPVWERTQTLGFNPLLIGAAALP